MIQKNNINFILFFTLAINASPTLYSMKLDEESKKQRKELNDQTKILNAQKIKYNDLLIAQKDEQIALEKAKKDFQETKNKQNLQKEELEIKETARKIAQQEKILTEKQKQEDREDNLRKIEDEKKAEELKQAQAATENLLNNNNTMRNIGIATAKSFTDGAGTGVGNSIVALVQKELELFYSNYRPTQATLLSEIDAASKIIRQGIDNVSENQDRQLKLIQSSNKNRELIDEEIRVLKQEAYNAYEKLKVMENESRNRLMNSYGYRNPEFKNKINNESATNIFDAPAEADNKNQNSPAAQKPGRIKRITDFMTKKTCDVADAIANTLPINSHLDKITQSEELKNSWINTYKTEISRVAALGLVATSLAILYKSYSWYYNEERVAACEAVVQLEEQKQQIAVQFKQEMAKPTVNAQDKIKLQKAYDNYMQQLQEEIDEQRAIAGYNIPKKLLIGSLIATSSVAGIVACVRYYAHVKLTNGTFEIPRMADIIADVQNYITYVKNYLDTIITTTPEINNNESTHQNKPINQPVIANDSQPDNNNKKVEVDVSSENNNEPVNTSSDYNNNDSEKIPNPDFQKGCV